MAAAVLLSLLPGCTREEDDLFEDSAAVRTSKAVAACKETLVSSQYGWVMDFYPSDGSLGGYPYTAVFSSGGEVTMRAPVSLVGSFGLYTYVAGDESSSYYDVISETGPVLTFNTSNSPFHAWSEPSSSSPGGYYSDYEFVFERASNDADTLFLHGKKHGMKLLMYRLDEDAGTYMSEALDMTAVASASIHGRLICDGVTYLASFINKRLEVDAAADSTVTIPYLYTDKGIRLYTPLTLGDVTFRDLHYDKEADTFSSPDGRALSPVPTAAELYANTHYPWYFIFDSYDSSLTPSSDEMDDVTESILRQVAAPSRDFDNCVLWAASVGRTDSNILSYYTEPDYCIGFRPYEGVNPPLTTRLADYDNCYDVACPMSIKVVSIEDSTVSIEPSSQNGFQWSGTGMFEDLYGPFAQHICDGSPYKVTFDSMTSPSRVTLRSVDGSTWFTLQRWDL